MQRPAPQWSSPQAPLSSRGSLAHSSPRVHRTELSRPAEVRELVDRARCFPCQQSNRRCHVERGALACLQCGSATACYFERLVTKQGALADFSWEDLVGSRLASGVPDGADRAYDDRGLLESSYPALDFDFSAPVPPPPEVTVAADNGSVYPLQGLDSPVPTTNGVDVTMTADVGSVDGTPCSVCGRVFTKASELSKHLARHTRPHKCPVAECDRAFEYRKDLDRHMASQHDMRRPDMVEYRCFASGCSKSEKVWVRRDQWRSHLRMRHGIEGDEEVTKMAELSNTWWREKRAAEQSQAQPHHSSYNDLFPAQGHALPPTARLLDGLQQVAREHDDGDTGEMEDGEGEDDEDDDAQADDDSSAYPDPTDAVENTRRRRPGDRHRKGPSACRLCGKVFTREWYRNAHERERCHARAS